MTDLSAIAERLDRLLAALERMAPEPAPLPDFAAAEAFLWEAERQRLTPVAHVNRVDIDAAPGDRPGARIAARQYAALCRRPAR